MKTKQEAIEAEVTNVKETVLLIKEKTDSMVDILDRLDAVLNIEVD